ncbi:MAG: hypothetical protein ACLQQ4_10110 [Bacteroidia bacterium]
MKASLLKNIRQAGDSSKGSKLNYKVVTFIMCLLLATILWFMNALSKKYDEPLKFYVNYENLPQGNKLYPSSYTVQIKVNTSGYRILAYKFGISDPTIKLDVNQFRHNYYYAFTSQKHMEKLQEQLGDAVKINEITPDTLFLHTQPVNPDVN